VATSACGSTINATCSILTHASILVSQYDLALSCFQRALSLAADDTLADVWYVSGCAVEGQRLLASCELRDGAVDLDNDVAAILGVWSGTTSGMSLLVSATSTWRFRCVHASGPFQFSSKLQPHGCDLDDRHSRLPCQLTISTQRATTIWGYVTGTGPTHSYSFMVD